jgi:uncharacterized protein (TIGR00661 family)
MNKLKGEIVKIIYGICGEGMGHASRSRIVIDYLLKQHHEITIAAGGKAYVYLSKFFDSVIKIEWPGVVYHHNEMKMLHSILLMSYKTLVGSIPSFIILKKMIKKIHPDVLITDGEPISYYAGRFSGIPCVSIDNPQAILYRKYPLKGNELLSWIVLSIAVKISIFNADQYLIYDFSDKQLSNPKVTFLKPLIQKGIKEQKPSYGNHIFVYQTSTSNNTLFSLLKNINEEFVIYGFNKECKEGNLYFKKFNEHEFYKDISEAKAVITNGGFTVLSEALYLKKPVLSIPVQHQFEQIMNGKMITQLEMGMSTQQISLQSINEFLSKLEFFKKNLKKYNSGNQKEILEFINNQIQHLKK